MSWILKKISAANIYTIKKCIQSTSHTRKTFPKKTFVSLSFPDKICSKDLLFGHSRTLYVFFNLNTVMPLSITCLCWQKHHHNYHRSGKSQGKIKFFKIREKSENSTLSLTISLKEVRGSETSSKYEVIHVVLALYMMKYNFIHYIYTGSHLVSVVRIIPCTQCFSHKGTLRKGKFVIVQCLLFLLSF